MMTKALEIVRGLCALAPRFPPVPLPDFKVASDIPFAPQVSEKRALVSPDVEPTREEPLVSSFQLDDTIDNLSPESCANIVDFVIGEVDHIIFPPLKRRKLNA